MNFEQILYDLPVARLKEIFAARSRTFRGVPRVSDKRELVKFLAGALRSYDSITAALQQTSLPELRALTAIVARGGEVSFHELAVWDDEVRLALLNRAIDGLQTLGLAFRSSGAQGPEVYVPKAVRSATPLPLTLRCRLPDAFNRMEVAAVTHIHESLGLKMPAALDRRALATDITRELTNPTRLIHHTSTMSPDARSTLAQLMESRGDIPLRDIAITLEARKRNQLMTFGWPAQWHSGKPRNGVEELLSMGIAVIDNSQSWMNWNLVIPGEIYELLSGAPAIQDSLPTEPDIESLPLPETNLHAHTTLIRDAAYMMGFIERVEVVGTAAGKIHRNTLKTFAKGLAASNPRCAEFLYTLLQSSGLVGPIGKRNLFSITVNGRAWLSSSRVEQIRELYQCWRQQNVWDERFIHSGGNRKSYYDRSGIHLIREDAIGLLKELATKIPDKVASIRSLALKAHYCGWARFRYGEERDDRDKAPSNPLANVDAETTVSSNAELLRNIFSESLYFLGLTEIHHEPGGMPSHVRLSSLGRHMLLGEPLAEPIEDNDGKFVIQPNLEVYASPRLSANLLQRLFRIAEPSGPAVLSINRSAIRGAMDRGENLTSLLEFLNVNSRSGIPQNVEHLIREIGSKHGHIRIGQAGLYIKVNDPILLEEIRSLKSVDIHFREDLADTVALIAGNSVDSLLKQLRQAGYLPVAVEHSNGTSRISDEFSVDAEKARYRSPAAPAICAPDNTLRIDWDSILASENANFHA
jgi:hypothetical protein